MSPSRARSLVPLALLAAACGTETSGGPAEAPPFEPVLTLATHNVGTTLFLAMLAESPESLFNSTYPALKTSATGASGYSPARS